MTELYIVGLQCRKRRGIKGNAHKIDPNSMKKVKILCISKEKLWFGILFVIYKHLNLLYSHCKFMLYKTILKSQPGCLVSSDDISSQ